jgi:hypothetical protein
MKVLSVNVGQPRENPWKTMKLTGIDKRPVKGPVMVTAPRAKGMGMVGLAGDRVYDVREHGRPDKAVDAYAREDMDFWPAELDLTPGTRSRSCTGPITTSPWPWSSGRCSSSRSCCRGCVSRLRVANDLPAELKEMARRRTG